MSASHGVVVKSYRNNMLPSFFVVGAQKSGTSSLHACLSRDIRFALPASKETHFFSKKRVFDRGIGWYAEQFRKNSEAAILGEVDPDYMLFPDAMNRIREHVTDPKLIFILRNPLDRAYSHYLMTQRRGYEELSFRDALLAEEERLSAGSEFNLQHYSYALRGRYCALIHRCLSVLPNSKFLILNFEDMFLNDAWNSDFIMKIYDFLGMHPPVVGKRDFDFVNRASRPRYAAVNRFVWGENRFKKIIGRLIPSASIKLWIMQAIDRHNQMPINVDNQSALPAKYMAPDKVLEDWRADLSQLNERFSFDSAHWVRQLNQISRRQSGPMDG